MTTKVEQVGGTHYGAAMNHWDLIDGLKIHYLEGNSTKYIFRWKDKNGLQDLKKAMSYIDKMLASTRLCRSAPTVNRKLYDEKHAQFFNENVVGAKEQEIILLIHYWKTRDDLEEAKKLLQELINKEIVE